MPSTPSRPKKSRSWREANELRTDGYDGDIVSFEVLEASKHVENATEMQFAVA